MEELFERVREEASRGVWSRGVELARSGAVCGERDDGDEVALRVRPDTAVVSPLVILYVDDAEWECDCGGDADPCEHVAAAAIALRRRSREGEPLPRPSEAAGRLRYRLRREDGGIVLDRLVELGGETVPLRTTLGALASGRVDGPAVAATRADLAVERALGTRLAGPLPRGVLHAVLAALADCEDVELEGRKVRARAEPLAFRARVLDDPGGVRVRVEPEAPVDETLAEGVVRSGDALAELGPTRLSAREAEALLGEGRVFPPDAVPELLADVLPSLESRMEVSVETDRLPRSRREPPRLLVEAEPGEAPGRVSLLATLVYGDPPLARVDAGRLTHLGGPIPLRDEEAESRLLTQLRARTGLVPGRRVELGAEEALEVAEAARGLEAGLEGAEAPRLFRAPPLVPRVRAGEGGRLEVAFESRAEGGEDVADAGGRAAPEAVLAAWRSGEGLVPLEDGGFAPLPADWLARHGERLADLLAARDADGRVPRAALPDLGRLCEALDVPPPPDLEPLRALLGDFRGLPHAELPEGLDAVLRPYQRVGVDWLVFLREAGLGGLLADDMGLGKTLQALCALRGRALVVAPTSLLPTWQDEVARFRPDLRVEVYHGSDRELDPDAEITLTTWALLRRDVEELAAQDWDAVVLDEAQAIKNPDSQAARAAFSLRAPQRIALTGTPIENRLEELWSQLHFLNPGLLGGREDFVERIAKPVADGDEQALARLRERLRPFVLRRRKADVAPELPPRSEVTVRVALDEEERAVYDAVRAATREEVVAKLREGGSVMAALEALLRLRQACCDVALLPGQEREEPSSKLALLADRLENALDDGHKALVFSQWTSLLDRIEPLLEARGIGFVRLDGATRDRGEVVRRFQEPEGPPVFLISLKAGGTGLTLTEADHVFLVDPWWNPAVEDQAADRAHRIGQERPVLVHRLVAEDSVEERVLALQARKRELADAALEGAQAAGSLTRDDLLALLD
ncbi:MAG: DEAD/DEAH box helicase [Myxococcota bacterium]|nr:DEAD/DEAH box helicase [Myxococcota bacterium]